MDIFSLASKYCKIAKTTLSIEQHKEIAGTLQELIKRATDLYNDIALAVRHGIVDPQAMTDANNIRSMTAYLVSTFNQPETDWNAMRNQHKNIVALVKRVYNAHNTALFEWAKYRAKMHMKPLPERYNPISKIQEGLAVVDSLLQQQAKPPTDQTEL